MLDWKNLTPYFLPLLVLFLMYRRIGRVRKVRVTRLWIGPVIIIFAAGMALYASGMPSVLWFAAYVIAAIAGAAVGYLRSRHTHLSVNIEKGNVESRQTPVATAIIMGLFAVKFGLNMAFPQLNGGQRPSVASLFTPDTVDAVQAAQQVSHTASTINYATDTLLIFSTVLLVTSAAETWLRAKRLLAAHRGETGDITD
jgi:hypothetical protein